MIKYKFVKKFKNKTKNDYRIVEDFYGHFFKSCKKKNINIILYKTIYSKKNKKIRRNIFKLIKIQIFKIAKEFEKASKIKNQKFLFFYKIKKFLYFLDFFYKIALKLKKCYKRVKQISYFINLQREEKKPLFYSKVLPFAPKEPFKKFKTKNTNHSLITYKGRFYSLLQLQLLHNISSKELKKNKKKLKYIYKKNENFLLSFEYKLYIFLYKLGLFYTSKNSLDYIKKFGIFIEYKLIKLPTFFIKKNSFLEVPQKIFLRFINFIKLKSFIANFLINNIIFNILININTFTIYILQKNYNYIYMNIKELFFKKNKKYNSQNKVNTKILLNGLKYLKKK